MTSWQAMSRCKQAIREWRKTGPKVLSSIVVASSLMLHKKVLLGAGERIALPIYWRVKRFITERKGSGCFHNYKHPFITWTCRSAWYSDIMCLYYSWRICFSSSTCDLDGGPSSIMMQSDFYRLHMKELEMPWRRFHEIELNAQSSNEVAFQWVYWQGLENSQPPLLTLSSSGALL
jgi:hypothetical protein